MKVIIYKAKESGYLVEITALFDYLTNICINYERIKKEYKWICWGVGWLWGHEEQGIK